MAVRNHGQLAMTVVEPSWSQAPLGTVGSVDKTAHHGPGDRQRETSDWDWGLGIGDWGEERGGTREQREETGRKEGNERECRKCGKCTKTGKCHGVVAGCPIFPFSTLFFFFFSSSSSLRPARTRRMQLTLRLSSSRRVPTERVTTPHAEISTPGLPQSATNQSGRSDVLVPSQPVMDVPQP